MLEQSLRRLQTDHLDLWQIHGVSFDNDPDLFIRKGALLKRSIRRSARERCDLPALPVIKIRQSI